MWFILGFNLVRLSRVSSASLQFLIQISNDYHIFLIHMLLKYDMQWEIIVSFSQFWTIFSTRRIYRYSLRNIAARKDNLSIESALWLNLWYHLELALLIEPFSWNPPNLTQEQVEQWESRDLTQTRNDFNRDSHIVYHQHLKRSPVQ